MLDKEILKKILAFKKIAIAVSGGADSLFLLDLVYLYNQNLVKPVQITILTINHNFREETGLEIKFLSSLILRKYNDFGHVVLNFTDFNKEYGNAHNNARQMRYHLMSSWCLQNQYEALLTGHHADDQIETFLMRLQRGASCNGLSGIRQDTSILGLKVLRPLLHIRKSQIINYLSCKNMVWVNDRSNDFEKYERARLRQSLIPESLAIGILMSAQKMNNLNIMMQYYVKIEIDKFVTFDHENQNKKIAIISPWDNFCKLPLAIVLAIFKYIFSMSSQVKEMRLRHDKLLQIFSLCNSFAVTEDKTNLHFFKHEIYFRDNKLCIVKI